MQQHMHDPEFTIILICAAVSVCSTIISVFLLVLVKALNKDLLAIENRACQIDDKLHQRIAEQDGAFQKACSDISNMNAALASQIVTACQTRKGHLTVNFQVVPTQWTSVQSTKPTNTLD